MVEALYLVIGLMILMGLIPVITIAALALAILKRFVMRWNDPVERYRFRVRLGGNVAYFVAVLNAIAVLYYFVTSGIPLGDKFDPWVDAISGRLPEGWYLATMVAFLFGGFLLKITRSPYAAAFLTLLFLAQVSIELAPAFFALAEDPGLFARFFEEIERMNSSYQSVGGIPKTVMGTVLAGLVYGLALQATYYVLALTAFLISLQGTMGLRRIRVARALD
ncbi:MAG: hypothetical protein O7E53_02710 [Alphaproteobacteria bacterium]|nr:hypothetical protein [Alphaproteobacteria bacterium]